MTARPKSAALVVGGSDSSGGAGLQRDLRVLAELGLDALSAVAAVTAQSDGAVRSVLAMPPTLVAEQIAAARGTRRIAAVKVRMLGNRGIVLAVAEALRPLGAVPVVLDPVLVASSVGRLLDEAGREVITARLVPCVTVLTPDLPEAAALLGKAEGHGEEALARQAELLRALGPRAVLLKGGHDTGRTCADLLVTGDGGSIRLSALRLAVTMRGTGCALATTIAGHLVWGRPIPKACATGKEHVLRSLLGTPRPP